MAKLVLAMFTSLDGYVAGPNGELMPPPWSAEVGEAWADHNLKSAGHLIYGRGKLRIQQRPLDIAGGCGAARDGDDEPAAKDSRFPVTLSGDPGWNAAVVSDDLPRRWPGSNGRLTAGDYLQFRRRGLGQEPS